MFVHESVVDQFIKMMIDCTKRMFGENDTGSSEQGKIINDFHLQRILKLIENSGGKIVHGGKSNASVKHIQPTIILNPSKDSKLMEEEIFGPVMPILTYSNFDEVINYINDKPKPLAVYFYGSTSNREVERIEN